MCAGAQRTCAEAQQKCAGAQRTCGSGVLQQRRVCYNKDVCRSAENVWQRGLLKKGLGLCHGISGNGYAFLSAYRATQNVTFYQQAQAFGLYAAQVRPLVDSCNQGI